MEVVRPPRPAGAAHGSRREAELVTADRTLRDILFGWGLEVLRRKLKSQASCQNRPMSSSYNSRLHVNVERDLQISSEMVPLTTQ